MGLRRVIGLEGQAEEMETRDQAARLRAMGCEVGRGYLGSPPPPTEAAVAFLAEHPG